MKYALSFTVQDGIITSYMHNNIATCDGHTKIDNMEFCTTVFDSREEYQKAIEGIIYLGVAKKLNSLIIQ